jgi:glycosyltransferase involved in cell wall biosynthesis
MTAAVTQLLSDNSMTATISKNAREYAEQYDWNIIKNKWHNLLQSIAKS